MIRAAALAAGLLITGSVAAGELEVSRGKTLFDRGWSRGPMASALGPLYDAASCAACHPGGGRGSIAGPGLVVRLADDPRYGWQLQRHAVPGVMPEPAPDVRWEAVRLPGVGEVLRRPVVTVADGRLATLRLAPSLRGAAALARVPKPGGRFGWKAEIAGLDDQVASALSLDMGIGSPARPAAAGDCTPAQQTCLRAAADQVETSTRDLEALGAYLVALRPRPLPAVMAEGTALFADTGCAACHRPAVNVPADAAVTGTPHQTLRIYTDLTLHDLGDELADPSGFPNAARWRTAPLVDLGAADGFLHDGRARDLRETILWHGGEAASSRARFLALSRAAQGELMSFLAHL